jgi:hypothetical protein
MRFEDRGEGAVTPAPADTMNGRICSDRRERLPYEPPRLTAKDSLARTTLQSAGECVFDPPPCP